MEHPEPFQFTTEKEAASQEEACLSSISLIAALYSHDGNTSTQSLSMVNFPSLVCFTTAFSGHPQNH
eukprot:2965816-Prorocentrum_lima.AAC.1